MAGTAYRCTRSEAVFEERRSANSDFGNTERALTILIVDALERVCNYDIGRRAIECSTVAASVKSRSHCL